MFTYQRRWPVGLWGRVFRSVQSYNTTPLNLSPGAFVPAWTCWWREHASSWYESGRQREKEGPLYIWMQALCEPSLHCFNPAKQCCGSMTFWGGSGSGSADPCLWLMDPDTDPDPGSISCCFFRHWPSRCQQKTYFLHNFFCLFLFEATFTKFFKDKKSNRVIK